MKIKKLGTLNLVGLIGDGSKTTELWNRFDEKTITVAGNAYEVRFYQEDACDCFVGIEEDSSKSTGLITLIIPESEYAVFDVCVANGYDSENDNMDKWLVANKANYKQKEMNHKKYVVEIFSERFNEGIVEICIPIERVCNGTEELL